jgi:hypothetical protein
MLHRIFGYTLWVFLEMFLNNDKYNTLVFSQT